MSRILVLFALIVSLTALADENTLRYEASQKTLFVHAAKDARLAWTPQGVTLEQRLLALNTGEIRSVRIGGSGRVTLENIHGETLSIHSDNAVELAGSLQMLAIELRASSIEQTGSIHAERVTLEATGALNVRGSIRAGQSGDIRLLGRAVHVHGSARVTASDENGGGTIRIGGDLYGRSTLPAAALTIIERDALLDVSAPAAGHAGTVVVWSNEQTQFAGAIAANAANGNGGFVEVSGKAHLDYTGTLNVAAPHGTNGTVLFDPLNISIVGALPDLNGDTVTGDDLTDATQLDDPADFGAVTSVITVDALRTVLTSANVTLAATNNISLNTALDLGGIGNAGRTLTLNANGSISINGSISDGDTGSVDSLNLVLNADADNNGSGFVSLNSPINTYGGNLTIKGNDGGFGVYSSNALNTGGGDLTITGTGPSYGVFIGQEPDTGGGSLSVTGTSSVGCGIIFDSAITDLDGNNISILGTGADIGVIFKNDLDVNAVGTLSLVGNSSGRHGILFRDTGVFTPPTFVGLTAGGNITFTGTGTEFGIYVPGTENNDLLNGAITPLDPGALTINSTGGSVTIQADSTVAPGVGSLATGRHGFHVSGPLTIQADGNVSLTARGTQFAANIRTDLSITSDNGSVTLDAATQGKYGLWTGGNTSIKSALATTITSQASEFGVCVNQTSSGTGFDIIAGGAVSITGTCTAHPTDTNNFGTGRHGIWVRGPLDIQAGGDVTLNGTGTEFGVEVVNFSSNSITTTNGKVTVNGTTTGGHGIHMHNAALNIQATGDVAVTGSAIRHPLTFGTFSGTNTLSSSGGAVSVTATNTNSGLGDHTLMVSGPLQITALNNVSVNTNNGRMGVCITGNGNPSRFISTAGSVSLATNNAGRHAIHISTGLEIAGQTGVDIFGTGDEFGFTVNSFSQPMQIASAAGPITINSVSRGRHGMDLNGSLNMTAAGNITLNGRSGHFGLSMTNGTRTITSTGGSIVLSGDSTQADGDRRYGLQFNGETTISAAQNVSLFGNSAEFGVASTTTNSLSLTATNGTVAINANSNTLPTNFGFTGPAGRHGFLCNGSLNISGGAGVSITAEAQEFGFLSTGTTSILSPNGVVAVVGKTTQLPSNNISFDQPEGRHPFFINAPYTISGSQGVTLDGSGRVYGIELLNITTPTVITPTITSANGTVVINGTSTANGVAGTYGVLMGVDITAKGVNITANSADNAGVLFVGGTVNSGGGALTVNGTSTAAEGVLIAEDTVLDSQGGALTITGTGSGAQDVYVANTNTPTITPGAGVLTFNADTIHFEPGTPTVTGTGSVVIQPRTPALNFTIGTSEAGLNTYLSQPEIELIANGFASITVGSATGTGAITVDDAQFTDSVVIRSPAGTGSIVLAGNLTTSDNAGVTLTHAGPLTVPAGTTVAASGAFVENGGGAVTLRAPISGATATFNDAVTIPVNLTLTGAPVTFLNQVTPGANVLRTLTINGGLTLGGTATLNLDVDGFTTGLADVINVTGPVAVDGTLNLDLTVPLTAAATRVLVSNDGTDAVTGRFSAVLSAEPKAAVRYSAGDGNDISLVRNTPPVIQSILVTDPGIPGVNPHLFTTLATDVDGQPLTFTYDYGDGSAGDSSGSHVYTTNGIFTVTVVVSDGIDSVSQTVTVSIIGVGALPGDTDGDGFDDFIETPLNSDPLKFQIRPFGLPVATIATEGLTIKRLRIRSKANKIVSNRIDISGTINTAPKNREGETFIVAIGGIVRGFVFSTPTRSPRGGTDSLVLTKPKAKDTATNFKGVIARSSFQNLVRQNGSVQVIVFFNNTRYEVLAPAK